VNWRIVFEQRASDWRVSEFLRIENLFDKQYVGSMIIATPTSAFSSRHRGAIHRRDQRSLPGF